MLGKPMATQGTIRTSSSEDVQTQAVPLSRGISADEHAEPHHVAEVAGYEETGSKLLKVTPVSEKSSRNVEEKKRFTLSSAELAAPRRAYVLLMTRTVVLITILMWISLPAFWGALVNSAKLTRNLEAWFIDRDDSRIGHALWDSFQNATSSPGLQLGWVPVSPSAAGTDDQVIASILNQEAWIALIIEANATTNLALARQNGDVTYNPSTAITVYYSQARNELATGTYVLPLTTQLLQHTTSAYATGTAQRYFAQITPGNSTNTTALQMLAIAPQTISPAISWSVINLRPYTAPAAQAVTLVGNIFLCIFAFMITMANNHARTLIGSRLTLSSYIALRIIAPLIAYIPLSMSYTLVSLAFDLPFGAKYTTGSGFMLIFIYVYLGMAALGLSLEAMITILTPRFTPFFLFLLIIYNVSPVLLPQELQSPFFLYGVGFPIFNLSQAVRTILFNTQSALGRNAAVMVAWILLSCGTLSIFTWITRRRERAV